MIKKTLFPSIWLIPALTLACSGQPAITEPIAKEDPIAVSEVIPVIPAGTIYEKQDSLTIEKLLQEAQNLKPEDNRMLFFGQKFINVPYVGHTLEKGEGEVLVVNTRELDCTTFVETCLALTLADKRNLRTFADYCEVLKQIRYRQGKREGYTSRLHYFTQWVKDNEAMGYVEDKAHEGEPFTATQMIDLHFMSTHPDSYSKLKGNSQDVQVIKSQEDEMRGLKVKYIPNRLLNGTPEALKDVQDGDIIGIQTSKDGLDTSHLGLAYWKNGKLHLLNASSLHKAVWVDTKTLYEYAASQKSMIGIRVIKVK